jgi:hypothetical protein
MNATLTALFQVAEPERLSRLREFRLASLLLLGRGHPLTSALTAAISDPALLDEALTELNALPALPRRRLLATLAVVLQH